MADIFVDQSYYNEIWDSPNTVDIVDPQFDVQNLLEVDRFYRAGSPAELFKVSQHPITRQLYSRRVVAVHPSQAEDESEGEDGADGWQPPSQAGEENEDDDVEQDESADEDDQDDQAEPPEDSFVIEDQTSDVVDRDVRACDENSCDL